MDRIFDPKVVKSIINGNRVICLANGGLVVWWLGVSGRLVVFMSNMHGLFVGSTMCTGATGFCNSIQHRVYNVSVRTAWTSLMQISPNSDN